MNYKMIVLDLDDTLLRDDHTISPRTLNALMLAQEQGVKVVLASGRPTFGMQAIAKQLKLADHDSYILSFNGGKIINCRTNEELFSSTLTFQAVKSLYELSKREDVFIHTYVGDEIITEKDNKYSRIESEITGLTLTIVNSFIDKVTSPPVKVLMVEDPDKLVKVEKTLANELSDQFSIMRSKPYFLEFTEQGVTKGTSLAQLIKACDIKQEEVIAIGDSYNDLEMIEFAGLGVAMGNAPVAIKDKANFVTDTNMNDGVAKVIEEYVLNESLIG
ncbi:hypothetical protein SAMN04488134_101637 [Amphibacillus marinus]|uniref:Haloacid dehalogenase-like hydrolase n=1 Tax=Amphibacillus marinus TaxID=872970 RepID=A0A1H8IKD1_9BACI|nr:Cof-type HAD-IIB family hydrolase [Amphibacillus marinus]SEN68656.1 hypothetical protein SAMN04488134_101637 [Amphibacillus marinus]